MQELVKELTPVEYGDSGVRYLNFIVESGHRCIQLHWHERMEIIKINRGSIEIDVNEKKTVINTNEIYIIPPKIPHTAIAKSDVEYDVIMFDIRSLYNNTKLSDEILMPIFNGNVRFDIKTGNPEIVDCYNELVNTLEQDSLLALSLVYKMVGLIFKNCLLEFRPNGIIDTAVTGAIKFIEENYDRDISTKSLAKKFGYSSEHFCRKFKSETWLTPMKYLKIYRLEMSERLLKERKYTITEIAAFCGFDDANYFTRCFKAHFSVSPTKYLATHKK